VSDKPEQKHQSAAELLAEWRAAVRDTNAARGAAKVAELALTAAAAPKGRQRATLAARRARTAAGQAAGAASLAFAAAEGDKVRADHDIEVAERAEEVAQERFREAEDEAFRKD
jgi:hypothetical protein